MSFFMCMYVCKQSVTMEVKKSAFTGVERVIFFDDEVATGGELTDVV